MRTVGTDDLLFIAAFILSDKQPSFWAPNDVINKSKSDSDKQQHNVGRQIKLNVVQSKRCVNTTVYNGHTFSKSFSVLNCVKIIITQASRYSPTSKALFNGANNILQVRRQRCDLIEYYKILTGKESIDPHQFFHLSDNSHGLRGHSLELSFSTSRLDLRQEAKLSLGQPTVLSHSTSGSHDVIGHVTI